MRNIVSFCLLLMTFFALTTVAYADAIVGPVDMVFSLVHVLRPLFLVVAAAVITILLLKRFGRKK